MGIPESQLDTWSHQGAVVQSRDTYKTIKRALEDRNAPYAHHKYSNFLQGSYANDTNVWAESDVDIVILLHAAFQKDLSRLSEAEKDLYSNAFSNAAYTYKDFKKDVIAWLTSKFGKYVKPGNKAILVEGDDNRRDADVLPAIKFRKYYKFNGLLDQDYAEGICFYLKDGTLIVNFPKQHSDNCTAKHQNTKSWFKRTVRVLKNMRNDMIGKGLISDDLAPSYYLEGLLYNVPDELFGYSLVNTLESSLDYIVKSDRDKFVCANEQYYLLHPTSPVTWRAEKCTSFIEAVLSHWKNWRN